MTQMLLALETPIKHKSHSGDSGLKTCSIFSARGMTSSKSQTIPCPENPHSSARSTSTPVWSESRLPDVVCPAGHAHTAASRPASFSSMQM